MCKYIHIVKDYYVCALKELIERLSKTYKKAATCCTL